MMNDDRESDSVIVSAKPSNKTFHEGAERVEKRTLTKGNAAEQNRCRAQNRESLQSALSRIRQAATRDKAAQFTSLMHHIANPLMLEEAFYSLKKTSAAGIDGVTWESYRSNLSENLSELSNRLLRGAYRARNVRRVFISKSDGGERPLGVPCLEDKIVQRATVAVLNEIYETDFLGFSYGFRPGRGTHQALDAVYTGILTKKVNHVLDADIKGFFDVLDHDKLMLLIEKRIRDPRVLRLVRKWLKAGILVDGKVETSESGTPQGGSASPLLANIFLHYVLDVWLQNWRTKEASGNVVIVRYCDDFVVGFERKPDANRFLKLLKARFSRAGLELHPVKTRLIEFGPFARTNASKRGKRSATFNFLGFTHICGTKHSNGMFTIFRRTISKKKRHKLKEVKDRLRERMHQSIPEVGKYLKAVLIGHYRYYGVPGNFQSLNSFRTQVMWRWYKTLKRRSQKSKLTWDRMLSLSTAWLPLPTIYHPYPLERMGVTTRGRSRMR